MSMNLETAGQDEVFSQINTTPLVDVMLVLLIIFLITIPVVTTSIPVQLPVERVEERRSEPGHIIITVDRNGKIFWFDAPLANAQALAEKLKAVASMNPQPEVQIRGDQAATYEGVGRVLYACQIAGIAKVAFVTEPPAPGA